MTSIQCTKGCGACCHFPLISATAGEAFVVLVKLLGAGETPSSLSERLSPYAERYFQFANRQGGLPFTQDRQGAFLAEKLPCPFLVKTDSDWAGHCGIYKARPNICESYHSTDHPSLCAKKLPHGMIDSLLERTDETVAEIRHAERSVFGRSALGHFPLLLLSLLTNAGLQAFLKETDLVAEADEQGNEDWATAQHMADFDLFVELMESIGYSISTNDIQNLIEAQKEAEASSRS